MRVNSGALPSIQCPLRLIHGHFVILLIDEQVCMANDDPPGWMRSPHAKAAGSPRWCDAGPSHCLE